MTYMGPTIQIWWYGIVEYCDEWTDMCWTCIFCHHLRVQVIAQQVIQLIVNTSNRPEDPLEANTSQRIEHPMMFVLVWSTRNCHMTTFMVNKSVFACFWIISSTCGISLITGREPWCWCLWTGAARQTVQCAVCVRRSNVKGISQVTVV